MIDVWHTPCHPLQILANFIFESMNHYSIIRGPEHDLESVAESIKLLKSFIFTKIEAFNLNPEMTNVPGPLITLCQQFLLKTQLSIVNDSRNIFWQLQFFIEMLFSLQFV